jgi:outer membrane lipoprotein-sorting protein
MGSEFAFEDLSSQEIEKFTYEYIKDAPCGDGLECFVVKRFPVDKYSGYSSQNVWLDKAEYRIQTIEIYDRKRDLLKTFTASDQKRFEGNFWRSMTQKMVNHQNGKSTDLIFSNYEFNLDIKDSDFTKNGLKRLR